jgi:hypothetical protein
MPVKTLFQKSKDATDALVEAAKALVIGSAAFYEEQWIEGEEAIVRAESVYDENPSPENYAALQAARSALTALEDPLASARRRELRKAENVRTGQIRAELKRKAEIVREISDAVSDFDTASRGLSPAAKGLTAAIEKAHALADTRIMDACIAVLHAVPFVVADKMRCIKTVKQSGVSPEVVETLAYHLKGMPVIDETGAA